MKNKISLQVTRSNFPAHIVQLWTPATSEFSFNLVKPLKDGFEKTGIFPFSSDILRNTVDPQLKLAEDYSDDHREIYADIASMLQNKLSLKDDQVKSCILSIKQAVHGLPVSCIVAAELHKSLLSAAPQKKRKKKTRGCLQLILAKEEAMRKAKENALVKNKQGRKRKLAEVTNGADIQNEVDNDPEQMCLSYSGNQVTVEKMAPKRQRTRSTARPAPEKAATVSIKSRSTTSAVAVSSTTEQKTVPKKVRMPRVKKGPVK